jgi:shikimate kinase
MSTPRISIVGLPGAGKTTAMKDVARRLAMPLKETDADMLRPVRKDLNHPVMQDFAAGFDANYGQPLDISLLPKTAEFMDKYGTKAFRDFEENLFVWSMKNGTFDNHLVDLGGSIFLREGSRDALKEANITTVYLDAPEDTVVRYLMQGFEDGIRTGKVSRSNYHTPALEAMNNGKNPEDVLRALSNQHRQERDPAYRLADYIVKVAPGDSLDKIVSNVIAAAVPPAPTGTKPPPVPATSRP